MSRITPGAVVTTTWVVVPGLMRVRRPESPGPDSRKASASLIAPRWSVRRSCGRSSPRVSTKYSVPRGAGPQGVPDQAGHDAVQPAPDGTPLRLDRRHQVDPVQPAADAQAVPYG